MFRGIGYYLRLKIAANPPNSTQRATGIQAGDKTHHQLHEMNAVSFSTIKTMVSRPKKPMPEEEELLAISVEKKFKSKRLRN